MLGNEGGWTTYMKLLSGKTNAFFSHFKNLKYGLSNFDQQFILLSKTIADNASLHNNTVCFYNIQGHQRNSVDHLYLLY